LKVVSINKETADYFVLNKHYTKRASIFWKGFGLVIGDKIDGVCVYGQPSPAIQSHAFAGRDFRLYELSRLVIQTTQRNAASFLIANSLRMLETPCAVVSYADTDKGHCGIVYQATNWLYTGSTVSHDKKFLIDGKVCHSMTVMNKNGITDPVRWAKENDVEMIDQKPKHRYFYFCGNKYEKKMMKSKLVYNEQPYPKSDKTMYDAGANLEVFAPSSLDEFFS